MARTKAYTNVDEWISLAEAGRRIGASAYETIQKTLTAGKVRRRQLPGRRPEWNATDLNRLLEASVESSIQTEAPTAASA